jgi:hypothetical protein
MVKMQLVKWEREQLCAVFQAVLYDDKGKAIDLVFSDLIVWLKKDREVRPASNPLTASSEGGFVMVRMKGVGAGGADAWAILLAGPHELVPGKMAEGGGIAAWCSNRADRLASIGGSRAVKRLEQLEAPQVRTVKDRGGTKQAVPVANTAYREGLCVQTVEPVLILPSCLRVGDVRQAFTDALKEIVGVDKMKEIARKAAKRARKKRRLRVSLSARSPGTIKIQ